MGAGFSRPFGRAARPALFVFADQMTRRTFVGQGAAAVVAVLAAACNSTPPLANTRASAEALAAAVLDALARGDRAALDGLALSEQEFRDYVWPGLPASRPERNLPFSYVWGELHQKSDSAIPGTMQAHAGRQYVVTRVSFDGVTEYPGYRVHRAATFHVRDAADVETEIRVCGSVFQQDGAWKVFSYVVDE